MPRPKERDLREGAALGRFGLAVDMCEGYTPDCLFFGRCSNGGDCFESSPHLVAARMIERLLPKDGRAGMHFAYLRVCVEMLRGNEVDL